MPLVVGCSHTHEEPMPSGQDMSSPPADMALPPNDLRSPEPDLAQDLQPQDMPSMDNPQVTGLPTCPDVIVSANQLFERTVRSSCASAARCHGATSPVHWNLQSGDDLKRHWVNQMSNQTTRVPLVRPSNIHASYVMYKLMGQQEKVGGRGGRMPLGADRLPDNHLCNFINWIGSGAN
ncbi:MAG: hypothetical protein RMK29_03450 [Myxococcales bacterium]|nr:hypothetical protein [Myxococcota bacterium]MDW8280741.1 hypothetical protein [Myxococcales bacterium]